MAMTKKDYVAIARIIKENTTEVTTGQVVLRRAWTITKLSDYFEASNSRFDRAKFWKACGL